MSEQKQNLSQQVEALRRVVVGQAASLAMLAALLVERGGLTQEDIQLLAVVAVDARDSELDSDDVWGI